MTSLGHVCLFLVVVNLSLTCGFLNFDDDKMIPYSTIRMRRRLYAKRRHRNICNLENDDRNDQKLKEVIGKSDYVFTGKVVNYHADTQADWSGEKRRRSRRPHDKPTSTVSPPSPADDHNSDEANAIDVNLSLEDEEKSEMFVVEVRRVIKEDGAFPLAGRVVVRVPKEFVSGLEITSDPRLNTNCVEFHPVLKVRQTAILLTKKVNGSQFLELTYFPVAMTLRHLDRVDAAVTGKTHPLKFYL